MKNQNIFFCILFVVSNFIKRIEILSSKIWIRCILLTYAITCATCANESRPPNVIFNFHSFKFNLFTLTVIAYLDAFAIHMCIAPIFKYSVYTMSFTDYKICFFFYQKTLLSVTHVHTTGNVLELNLQVYVKIKDANVSQDTYWLAATVTRVTNY